MIDKERNQLYSTIGRRIRELREAASMTQTALGNRIGLSRASIVNIEKGRQHPPLHILWDVATLFEVEFWDLMPTQKELVKTLPAPDLDSHTRNLLELASANDEATFRALAEFVSSSRKRREPP